MTNSNLFGDNDATSQRRKREEQQVELRRQRTEELLNKKRVSSKDSIISNSFESAKLLLYSTNIDEIYQGSYECRTLLSVEVNPPIQEIITSGIVSRFIELLDASFYCQFGENPLCAKARFESAWVLTNIASGTSDQTKYLVERGAVPFLVKMIGENDDLLVDQSVWALGNIAGDSENLRDKILDTNALTLIIDLINRYLSSQDHIKILRNLVWLLSNLNRGRNPLPSYENMAIALKAIEATIQVNDQEIVSDCFWCLSYIVDASSHITDLVLKSPIMNRCFNILTAFVDSLNQTTHDSKIARIGAHSISPIIRMLGNIASGSEEQTDCVVKMGFLKFLHTIFYIHENRKIPRIRKEICWLLSNITAGNISQVTYVLESDLLALLIDSISRFELFVRKEASFAIMNISYFCIKNPDYLRSLLDNNILLALQQYLDAVNNIPESQAMVLDTVKYTLESGEKLKMKFGTNPVVQAMIDSKFIDEIEDLQDTNNAIVAQKAYHIIVTFFEGEEEQL